MACQFPLPRSTNEGGSLLGYAAFRFYFTLFEIKFRELHAFEHTSCGLGAWLRFTPLNQECCYFYICKLTLSWHAC